MCHSHSDATVVGCSFGGREGIPRLLARGHQFCSHCYIISKFLLFWAGVRWWELRPAGTPDSGAVSGRITGIDFQSSPRDSSNKTFLFDLARKQISNSSVGNEKAKTSTDSGAQMSAITALDLVEHLSLHIHYLLVPTSVGSSKTLQHKSCPSEILGE